MRERERSEWLARAIDDLVRGETSSPPAPDFEDEDLATLMLVAKTRLKVARTSAQAGIQYEGAIWRQVLNRLERYQPAAEAGASSRDDQAREREIEELQEIIGLRRQVAAKLAEAAEVHRDSVWQQVESRIASRKRLLFPFFPRRHAPAAPAATPGAGRWPRVAALAAGLAVIAAALGPIPATGFAHHPAVELADFVGDFIGVREGAAPPAVSGQPMPVKGIEITTEQAAELMHLPLAEPSALPAGFRKASSLFFSQPLTAEAPGLLALTYTAGDGAATLTVYQEAASGAPLAALAGSANALVLADSTPATYFEGTWQPAAGQFVWAAGAAQTLAFERDGVRIIIRYTGPRLDRAALSAVAESMVR